MPATFRQIVDDAQVLIGEVSGVGTQEFSDDRMFADAIRGFNTMFKKCFWHPYRSWVTVVLDGVLGIPTTDAFTQVIDFDDIRFVHRAGEVTSLPILTEATNPNTITGTRARFWTSLNATNANYAGRKLQIYPLASIGSIDVMVRKYPLTAPATEFDWQDIIYLDRDLLVYATAFMTLMGDGLNSEAAGVVKALLDGRYVDITSGLANHRINIDNNNVAVPLDWRVI